jgi:hypothetical protein
MGIAEWSALFRMLRACSGQNPAAAFLRGDPVERARHPPAHGDDGHDPGQVLDALDIMPVAQWQSGSGGSLGAAEDRHRDCGPILFAGLPDGLGGLPPGSVVCAVELDDETVCSVFPYRDGGWEAGPVIRILRDV